MNETYTDMNDNQDDVVVENLKNADEQLNKLIKEHEQSMFDIIYDAYFRGIPVIEDKNLPYSFAIVVKDMSIFKNNSK